MRRPREVAASDLLTAEVVERIVALADGPDVRAITIVGSAARGDATAWSDIDVDRHVADGTEITPTRAALLDDRLVMISTRAVGAVRGELQQPERAIWAVPALRDMRVLVDRDGTAEALKRAAGEFSWDALGDAARRYAARELAMMAEYVYKIRAALDRRDESAALHAGGALIGRCTRALATARGVLIRTENEYYRRVQEAAGDEWTRLHRAAFGLAGGDAFEQATAAGRLYAQTARLLASTLDTESREIVDRAVAIVP
ncbi:MAG: hypothetical protein ACRDF0_00715 [Candidatus Limnocylindria bacterium]